MRWPEVAGIGDWARRLLSVVFGVALLVDRFFDRHIVKLFGVKDFATLQAFDKLCVFMPGDDSYPGVFAGGGHRFFIRWNRMLFPPIVAAFY